MTYFFVFFAAILVWLSFKSFRGGLAYLAYFRTEPARTPSHFAPFATVICPCRGLDQVLNENLAMLLDQDYPDHEVIFVVDRGDDASVAVINEVRGNREKRTKLIVAPKAASSSQKVENLREAVLHASDHSEILVFVDSDVRPSRDWLRCLVAPLAETQVGAATGYRWFISERPTLASELRSVWNASIASALGPNTRSNFCWGGSLAIRTETFERLNIRDRLKGTLSDDFTVTRVLNEAGMQIVFVPRALVPSIGDCSLADLVEFTTRQMKITRVYAPKLWLMSLFGSGLFIAVMIAAFLIVLLSRQNDLAVLTAIGTLALVLFFSVGKSWLRLAAVRLVLTGWQTELRRQSFTQNTLWLLTPMLFFYNSLAALFSRDLTWRGTRYKLKSPTETVIIRD